MSARAALVAAALWLPAAGGASTGAGSAFGEGLRLTNTAWALGMGGAMAAAGEGVSAIALNPAGLSETGPATASLTHTFYVERIQEDYLAWAQRLPVGALGVSVHGIWDGTTPRTLADAGGSWLGDAGTFPMGFAVGGAAYALDLSWFPPTGWLKPSAGAGARVMWQQVDRATWLGMTTDLGVRVRPAEGVTVAGVLQNAGLAKGPSPLPLQWVTGVSWQKAGLASTRDRLLLEVDSPVALDRGLSVRAGAEYRLVAGGVAAAVRGGWKQEAEVPGASGLAAGVGFRWKLGRVPWGLDYAFVPWGIFGGLHALALTVAIAPPPPPVVTPITASPTSIGDAMVFYPVRGEVARVSLALDGPAEVSAMLVDERGMALATLLEQRLAPAGTLEITWNGVLPDGRWAEFDRTYRFQISRGGVTFYRDVIPRAE